MKGRYYSRGLHGETSLETIHGENLGVETVNGKVRVEGARLLFKDVRARNGMLHLVYPSLRKLR